jgi:hypothetical protein
LGALMKTDMKQWTLSIIDASRDEFKTFIANIPVHERKTVGKLKQWSAKDEVAHLGYWLEVFVKNIKARRSGKPLIDASDYLAMNDKAWEKHKDLSWAEVEEKLARAFQAIEKLMKALSVDALTDAKVLTLEPDRSSPRPLIKSLFYELIDHPVHHFVKLYQKHGANVTATTMLTRLQGVLEQPGVSKWTGDLSNQTFQV